MPAPSDISMDLCCQCCGWLEVCGRTQIIAWLRKLEMLKRNPHPSCDELRELLLAAAPKLACPACGDIGLAARTSVEEETDWETSARCEVCRAVIPPERLEIFPNTRLCVACQQSTDAGDAPPSADFCPRCGVPMQVRQAGGRGIARYALICPSCGKRA